MTQSRWFYMILFIFKLKFCSLWYVLSCSLSFVFCIAHRFHFFSSTFLIKHKTTVTCNMMAQVQLNQKCQLCIVYDLWRLITSYTFPYNMFVIESLSPWKKQNYLILWIITQVISFSFRRFLKIYKWFQIFWRYHVPLTKIIKRVWYA